MFDIEKEIDKAYNENPKIPFMLSKAIFSYAYKKGFELSKSQIDNLSGQVKKFKKSSEELETEINSEEFRKKVNEKNIEYKIYTDLIYKLQEAIESRKGEKVLLLYDEIRKKLELLKLEINK